MNRLAGLQGRFEDHQSAAVTKAELKAVLGQFFEDLPPSKTRALIATPGRSRGGFKHGEKGLKQHEGNSMRQMQGAAF